MPNADPLPQAIVVRPGWATALPTEAALQKALAKQALRTNLGDCLLLVPSCSMRLGAASAVLRSFGCRWRLTLIGSSGGETALWLVGERSDAALVDSAACERLARAAGIHVDALMEVLEADLGFSTVSAILGDDRCSSPQVRG